MFLQHLFINDCLLMLHYLNMNKISHFWSLARKPTFSLLGLGFNTSHSTHKTMRPGHISSALWASVFSSIRQGLGKSPIISYLKPLGLDVFLNFNCIVVRYFTPYPRCNNHTGIQNKRQFVLQLNKQILTLSKFD